MGPLKKLYKKCIVRERGVCNKLEGIPLKKSAALFTMISLIVSKAIYNARSKKVFQLWSRKRAFELEAFDVVEKNIRGVSSVREIIIKTKADLACREKAHSCLAKKI